MSVTEYTDKSTLLTLFEELRAKILASVPAITEVVIYTNQEENESTQRPFAYPYVSLQMTIDWESNEARGTSSDNPPVAGAIGLQSKGAATIMVHTLFKNREDDTPSFIRNEAIRHEVHRAIHLHYLEPFFTRLIKVKDDLPIEINASQDYTTTYTSDVKEGARVIGTLDTIDAFGIDDGRPDLTIP